MNRRDFSAHLMGLGLGATALPALAQEKPVEGKHYVKLGSPAPVNAPAGKIEVIEFFWYGCPHCNAFEPTLDAWQKKLPADVAFRRVPVAFREQYAVHQRIYYALEALGKVEALHRKVFYALHSERQRLEQPAEIAAFMEKNGIERAKFQEVFDSFAVQTRAKQATRLADAYKIDGVPAMGIHGKYFTSGTIAGTPEKALQVTEYLVQTLRKG
ncbi:thiol:disulfide interchange protein DsbA/DsbL [Rhizobacter sp. J219]|jgi:thiol:disulfide interchange protein DsbA|uniref:thiol:disulfide interchange protein DsbA/DsbL n=1 Tax=Rhizobacter sp. J219 TaxID=2898430 RepID=UPI002150E4B1|nr:thiol:disulfide interchange protein DsbA/DsbL [Rhizobacter sp. J219]MCR5884969.1 thiol:disulfide interchange protein DsbA/DsbL [Rhizobacter sp. J219]